MNPAQRPAGRSGPRDTSQVQSLRRALTLLETLAEHPDGITLAELSRRTGLAVSTAHRLLTTLESARFVRFDPALGMWQIGVGAFTIGSAFARSRDILTIARPIMRWLMEESGETVNLYLLDDDEVICMGQVECRQVMRAIARPGGRVGLHCSGAGKAFLAAQPEARRKAMLERQELAPITPRTITDLARLEAELRATRERGYAIDDEENAIGLRCVAALVLDEADLPFVAISLSGPSARITDDVLPRLGMLARRAAGDIAAAFGGRVPPVAAQG